MQNQIKHAQLDLKRMHKTIKKIENLVRDLKTSGTGVPMVEKNTLAILSFVNILKLGIADPAELMDQ